MLRGLQLLDDFRLRPQTRFQTCQSDFVASFESCSVFVGHLGKIFFCGGCFQKLGENFEPEVIVVVIATADVADVDQVVKALGQFVQRLGGYDKENFLCTCDD